MDAAGRDYVIVETVGVGQDEVEIARLAQVTVVVLVPGMGDDVQAIKAGIMEIADIFAINKADQPGADQVEREIKMMLSLAHGRQPAIVRTVATEGKGIDELLEAVGQTSRSAAFRRSREFTSFHRPPGHRRKLPSRIRSPFYELLGLQVTHRESVPTEKVNVAMLPAGDSRIELLEPAAPDSPISKFLEKRGPGLHHVALRVPDLARRRLRACANPARACSTSRAPGAGGHLYVFVASPPPPEAYLLGIALQENSN